MAFSKFESEVFVLPECQLLGTLGCHLCEQAEALLMPFVAQGLSVELLDIAEDEALLTRYALTIPALRRIDTGAELLWPFDQRQICMLLGIPL